MEDLGAALAAIARNPDSVRSVPVGAVGSDLLDELRETIERYVVMPSDAATDTAVLWTAATHAQDAWQHATRLVLRSPQKRCAKSRLMDVLSGASRKPLITVNATVAAIFRSIDETDPPALFVDEADTIFGKKQSDTTEELRGVLNAGFGRGRPALRCVGVKQEPTFFPTFAMACLAGIGDTVPDTITDRGAVLTLRRRLPHEAVSPYREAKDRPIIEDLGTRLGEWVRDNLDRLAEADPDLPVEDRAADVWQPLVAIADLAGGAWPVRARDAAVILTQEADSDAADESIAVRLLTDLRKVFTEPEMASADLVEKLRKLENSPWEQFDFKPRDLARRLKPYGVKPDRVRPDGKQLRGYALEDLADTFARYIPPDPEESLPQAPVPAGPSLRVTASQEDGKTDCDGLRETGGTNGNGYAEDLGPDLSDLPEWEPLEATS